MKFLAVALLTLALVGSALAGVFTNAYGHVVTVAADGTATIVVPAGTSAPVVYGSTYAQTVTNGQAVTLVPGTINVLTGVGQANGLTNTVTFANFAAADAGKEVIVAVASASTNAVAVAKTGNYYGPAKALAAGQKMAITVAGASVLYGP